MKDEFFKSIHRNLFYSNENSLIVKRFDLITKKKNLITELNDKYSKTLKRFF